MALGIHKPGEGYWVRVMTACMIAVAAIATAFWAFGQSAVVVDQLPNSSYQLSTRSTDVAPGTIITLLGAPDSANERPVLGTATVISVEPSRAVTLGTLIPNAAADPTGAKQVRTGDGKYSASIDQVIGLPPISATLLGGIVAAVVLLLGAYVAYWLTGTKVSTVEKLIATDYEMRKVNWSTPKEIFGSTWVVIGACFLLSLALYLFDQLFVQLVTRTGVL